MAVCACKPTHARERREIRLRACCGGTEERSSAGMATEPSAVKMGGRQGKREARGKFRWEEERAGKFREIQVNSGGGGGKK
eukprot:5741577-Pleurochrysis_carterae.AAC.1